MLAGLTLMGLLPGLDTLFGLAPLFGHDVWLHGVEALAAGYVGWVMVAPDRSGEVARPARRLQDSASSMPDLDESPRVEPEFAHQPVVIRVLDVDRARGRLGSTAGGAPRDRPSGSAHASP